MRKPISALVFFLLVISQVIGQQAPNCDGTEPKKVKCDWTKDPPAGFYESDVCEGKKTVPSHAKTR